MWSRLKPPSVGFVLSCWCRMLLLAADKCNYCLIIITSEMNAAKREIIMRESKPKGYESAKAKEKENNVDGLAHRSYAQCTAHSCILIGI